MKKFTIKEPTEAEFKAFKKEFLKNRAEQFYDDKVKNDIDGLMLIIGKLQSHNQELTDEIEKSRNENKRIKVHLEEQRNPKYAGVLRLSKRNLSYADLKKYVHRMLNELLFFDLKYGNFYTT